MKNLSCSPKVELGTFLVMPHVSACRPESIGVLLVKIGGTVEKLVLGVHFKKNPQLPKPWPKQRQLIIICLTRALSVNCAPIT
jgi:hypothetical protein